MSVARSDSCSPSLTTSSGTPGSGSPYTWWASSTALSRCSLWQTSSCAPLMPSPRPPRRSPCRGQTGSRRWWRCLCGMAPWLTLSSCLLVRGETLVFYWRVEGLLFYKNIFFKQFHILLYFFSSGPLLRFCLALSALFLTTSSRTTWAPAWSSGRGPSISSWYPPLGTISIYILKER